MTKEINTLSESRESFEFTGKTEEGLERKLALEKLKLKLHSL